ERVYEPDLALGSESVRPGDALALTLTGWAPDLPVEITIGGVPVGEVEIGARGDGEAFVTVPGLEAGVTTVRASQGPLVLERDLEISPVPDPTDDPTDDPTGDPTDDPTGDP